MAAAAAKDMFSVCVIADEPQRNAMFTLGSDTTIGEVKSLWQETVGVDTPTIFRRVDRSRLSERQQLSEVGEVAPGCKAITVLVEEGIEVMVEYYKRHLDERHAVVISSTEKPEDIHPHIRDVFSVDKDQLFRLITHEAPLNYDMTFEEQQVESGAVLLIDLGFVLEMVEEWSSTVHPRLFFASEKADLLLVDSDSPQRLLLGGVKMDLQRDVLAALPPDYRRFERIIVQHQHKRDISVMTNDFFKHRWVWPTDVSGKAVDKCPPLKADLFFEKERLPRDGASKRVDLPEHALVHTATKVPVKCSHGKRRLFGVPQFGTVADLEAAVSVEEGTTQFALKVGQRFLDRGDRLAKVMMDGQSIEVARSCHEIVVCLPDRQPVRFSTDRRQLSFTDIMEEVAEKGRLKMKALVKRELQCLGCKRTLTVDEEEFQSVPADCCRVRSLKLTDSTPTALIAAGSQGSWKTGDRVRTKQVGRHSGRASAAQQTSKRTAVSSTQHDRTPHLFRVFNTCGVGGGGEWASIRGKRVDGHAFTIDLPVGDRPTAGQILVAVAAHLAVSPADVTFCRKIGRRKEDGKEVLRVFDSRGDESGGADFSGRWTDDNKANWKDEELQDDDPFPIVPDFPNTIYVLRR